MYFAKELLIQPYAIDTVILDGQTSGSGSITLLAGLYEFTIVGAGGDGAASDTGTGAIWVAGGGSGAGFKGVLRVNAGTYNWSVGASVQADTSVSGIITAGGGKTAVNGFNGGIGGTMNISATIVGTPTTNSSGNNGGTDWFQTEVKGGTGAGGASVLNGYGHGYNYGNNGYYVVIHDGWTSGYLKIVYKGAY